MQRPDERQRQYQDVQIRNDIKDGRDGSADLAGQAVTWQFRILVLLHRDAYEDIVENLGNIEGCTDESSGVTEPSHGHAWLENSFA